MAVAGERRFGQGLFLFLRLNPVFCNVLHLRGCFFFLPVSGCSPAPGRRNMKKDMQDMHSDNKIFTNFLLTMA